MEQLPKWAAIELVGPSDEEQASAELLQHDHTLALVHSSEDDGDSSRGEGSPHLPDMVGKEVLGGTRGGSVHGWDVVGQLLGSDHPGAAVLGASDLLLNKHGGLLGSGLLVHLLGELVDCLLVVHAALSEPDKRGLNISSSNTTRGCTREAIPSNQVPKDSRDHCSPVDSTFKSIVAGLAHVLVLGHCF